MKGFLVLFALCASVFASAAEVSELKTLGTNDGVTKWTCTLPKGDTVANVSLSTNLFFEIEVVGYIKSRGYSVESWDPKEKVTYYYLTNGGYPSHFQFTLGKFSDGKTRLTLVWSATELVCETK